MLTQVISAFMVRKLTLVNDRYKLCQWQEVFDVMLTVVIQRVFEKDVSSCPLFDKVGKMLMLVWEREITNVASVVRTHPHPPPPPKKKPNVGISTAAATFAARHDCATCFKIYRKMNEQDTGTKHSQYLRPKSLQANPVYQRDGEATGRVPLANQFQNYFNPMFYLSENVFWPREGRNPNASLTILG